MGVDDFVDRRAIFVTSRDRKPRDLSNDLDSVSQCVAEFKALP
jgi:hypothetical protein